MIPLPSTPTLIGTIVVLLLALAGSVYKNITQWSDARAVDAAHTQALKLAIAEGRAQVIERNLAVADEMAEAAGSRLLLIEQAQQEFLVAQKEREREYWERMGELTPTCAPGEAFVDAFNEAMQP